ncbi:diguanylate cyclase domain-containing protein [Reinekea sp.]|jgi:diguanylate cyclase (GGDEF)-like protein|uniref:sensor domain-containing diguanylate cyclase n=1 Tax=Reinekea sp. TaxID=1970455 RepID=UPI00398970C5
MNQDKLKLELVDALALTSEEPTKAQLIAEKAIIRAQRNGWVGAMALANLVIAWSSVKRDLVRPALEDFHKALALFRDLNDSAYIAQCYFGLGLAYTSLGQYSLALEQYRKALSGELAATDTLNHEIHLALSSTLMNISRWSDAEQELLGLPSQADLTNAQLVQYQLQVLRLAFYRGDQRTIKDQIKLCEQLVADYEVDHSRLVVEFYRARYELKFGRFKTGYSQLEQLWMKGHGRKFYFLQFEAAQDLLRSDYPKKGIWALNNLLELDHIPGTLRLKIHQQLAHFYAIHLSFELATAHHQTAEKVANQVRDSEINEQWARFKVEEQQQTLRDQIAVEKHNNSVLAESNAMLQAVNRIALAVNAALDFEMLTRNLRDQLVGWIDVSVIAIGEVKGETLEFKCMIENNIVIPPETLYLTEERSWSVRAVNQGRILYENDFVLKNEILMTNQSNVVRSVGFVPLKFENKVIGLLTLQSHQPNVFDIKSISLLEYIAPVVSIAFANLIHLYRNIELSGEVSRQKDELRDVRDLMAHLSDHDELTDLPNRQSLNGHFKRWQPHGNFHCLMMSVTNLSELTTLVGYGTDDDIIKVIAKRLNNRLRPDDLLVRSTDDQFVLFIERMKSEEVLLELANQLKVLCEQPLRAKDQTISANIAISLVSYPDHGETLEELMSMASVSLKHAIESENGLFSVG